MGFFGLFLISFIWTIFLIIFFEIFLELFDLRLHFFFLYFIFIMFFYFSFSLICFFNTFADEFLFIIMWFILLFCSFPNLDSILDSNSVFLICSFDCITSLRSTEWHCTGICGSFVINQTSHLDEKCLLNNS